MSVAIVTGSAGLIGEQTVRFLGQRGFTVIGIDNDLRQYFFGKNGSTAWSRECLTRDISTYVHAEIDIRHYQALEAIFHQYRRDIVLVVHTAAQPSHDWAAREPTTDFSVNATSTSNLLELTRLYCPDAVFLYASTNKVYGDSPNSLPLEVQSRRWDLSQTHPYHAYGIDESMSIDQTLHSLFGASKLAADILVQEYGKYFNMRTVCFRAGCLTGPAHSGTPLHGFLSYLIKCAVTGQRYTIHGYQGKQVRDNLHAKDVVAAFWEFFQNPRCGEVYNLGGGIYANCSILEAIDLCQEITGRPMRWVYGDANRKGDHKWWISDIRKFQAHYPLWQPTYTIEELIREIHDELIGRNDSKAFVASDQVTVAK